MTVFSAIQYDLPYLPGVEHHFWNYARARIIERHLRRSDRKTVNHQALVLDVGCGVGLTVDYLRHVGLDCRGVGLGHPKLRPGLDDFVKIGTDARDLPVDIREQTGTILLLDVLEHIQDPVAFIAELRANFPMLERVVITVPARMELWSNYDVYYGHFLRYDMRQLALRIHRAALEIITDQILLRRSLPSHVDLRPLISPAFTGNAAAHRADRVASWPSRIDLHYRGAITIFRSASGNILARRPVSSATTLVVVANNRLSVPHER